MSSLLIPLGLTVAALLAAMAAYRGIRRGSADFTRSNAIDFTPRRLYTDSRHISLSRGNSTTHLQSTAVNNRA